MENKTVLVIIFMFSIISSFIIGYVKGFTDAKQIKQQADGK